MKAQHTIWRRSTEIREDTRRRTKKLIQIKWPTVTETSRQTAMYWLGIAHLQGQGVPRSVGKAKALFKLANKDNDHAPSHQMLLVLGVEHEDGRRRKKA